MPAIALGLLALGVAMPADEPTRTDHVFTMERYQRDHRPLLLFAPRPDDPQAESQRQRLRDTKPAFNDREMVLIEVYGDDSGRVGELALKPADARKLRDRFEPAPDGFALILVGKDGTEKARFSKPIPMEEIYGRIDRMPMRRREIRETTRPDPKG